MKALESEILTLGGVELIKKHNVYKIWGKSTLVVLWLIYGLTSSPSVAAEIAVFSRAASWEAIGGRDSKGGFFCGMQFQRKSPVLRIFYYNNKSGIHIWINNEILEMNPDENNSHIYLYFDNRTPWRLNFERIVDGVVSGYWTNIDDNDGKDFFDQMTRGRFLMIRIDGGGSLDQRVGLRGSLFIYDRFQECVAYLISLKE